MARGAGLPATLHVLPPVLPLLGLLLVAACPSDTPGPSRDAALETGELADGGGDVRAAVQTVNLTVRDCPSFDPTKPQCTGPAPLTVSFIPITTGTVVQYFWDFGDNVRSRDPYPTHTYNQPGVYDVTLFGFAGPMMSQKRMTTFINVTANPLGAACELETQCQSGLTCLCGANQCTTAFASGVCTQKCAGATCPASGLCANLTLGKPPMTPDSEPWRDLVCLRRCGKDADCAAGLRCRLVPVAGSPQTWEKACFYGFPGDLGAACRSAGGIPQNQLCLSGMCADLGALGACSADCSGGTCPDGTTCAVFNDQRRLCLKLCPTEAACRDDPLLSCTVSGGKGPLAFTAPPGTQLCAPEPCSSDTVCAPSGICLGEPGASHCARRAAVQ
jgi:hypothetical protein